MDCITSFQWFCPKQKEKVQHGAKGIEDEVELESGEEVFPLSYEVPKDKWLIDSGSSSS